MKKIQICLLVFIGIMLFAINCKSFPIDTAKSADIKSIGTIVVEMTGFRSNDGRVRVGLYNDADGFPGTPEKNSIIMTMENAITNNRSILEFKDVPFGTYAISGFHDENNNNQLDISTTYGTPKEGIVYSNNARITYGPAKFDDAKFELKSSKVKQTIEIIYF